MAAAPVAGQVQAVAVVLVSVEAARVLAPVAVRAAAEVEQEPVQGQVAEEPEAAQVGEPVQALQVAAGVEPVPEPEARQAAWGVSALVPVPRSVLVRMRPSAPAPMLRPAPVPALPQLRGVIPVSESHRGRFTATVPAMALEIRESAPKTAPVTDRDPAQAMLSASAPAMELATRGRACKMAPVMEPAHKNKRSRKK